MSERSTFHDFSDNTKKVCTITGVALLIIVVTMVAPSHMNKGASFLGKMLGISLLGYAFATNCRETTTFLKTEPNVFQDDDKSGIRNNVLLSYLFSLLLLLLALYVFFSFFF